jgi:hypothetical protein
MTELASGMPAPQFEEKFFVSARIRVGSRFKRVLCFLLIDVRCFGIPLRCLLVILGVWVPQVEYHWSIKRSFQQDRTWYFERVAYSRQRIRHDNETDGSDVIQVHIPNFSCWDWTNIEMSRMRFDPSTFRIYRYKTLLWCTSLFDNNTLILWTYIQLTISS